MMIFVAIAVAGFIFLAVSALFGDHDHEVHVEAHDVGLGDHPSPFSLRVISLFISGSPFLFKPCRLTKPGAPWP